MAPASPTSSVRSRFFASSEKAICRTTYRQQGGAEQILHFGSKVTKSLRFHLSFSGEVNQYEVTLKPTEDDSLFVSSEAASFWDKSRGFDSPLEEALRPLEGGQEAGISDPRATRIPAWVRARLAIFRLYHVHDTSSSSPMRKTSNVDDNHYLRQDAANLGAFLYLLQENHADEFAMVRSAVRRVAPYFDDFLLKPDPRNEETIRLAWRHKGSEQYLRRVIAVGRHASIHSARDPIPPAGEVQACGDRHR